MVAADWDHQIKKRRPSLNRRDPLVSECPNNFVTQIRILFALYPRADDSIAHLQPPRAFDEESKFTIMET
jgi:hypothetical protein